MTSTNVPAATYAIGDAVTTPDGVIHAVTALHGKRTELACGLIAKGLAPATDATATMCPNCANGTKAEAPAPAPVAVVETPADAPVELAAVLPEIADALQDNPDLQAEGEAALAADAAQAAAVTSTVANQPTKDAVASKTVGNYTLEQLKKGGNWRVRDVRNGQLEAEGFELLADAGWFAQRRTRLGAYVGFGGTRTLFMPKVPGNVEGYTIVGELGKVQLEDELGQRVGPIWRHKTNGKVDAFRWAQRLCRPTRATA